MDILMKLSAFNDIVPFSILIVSAEEFPFLIIEWTVFHVLSQKGNIILWQITEQEDTSYTEH